MEEPVPETLHVPLDRSSPVPLYHQVAAAIEAAIESGRLAPGALLENEIALAARLGISRPTARQALQGLVDRGRLVRRRGVGTQVAPLRFRRPVDLTSLFDDLTLNGRVPRTEVLHHGLVAVDGEVAAALEVPDGTTAVLMRRLRLVDEEPLALLTNYVPAALAPSAEELAVSGLYAGLRERGHHPRFARQRVGARLATAAEARILHEPPRAALLTMERTAFDETGLVIEYGRHIYRSSRYEFDTTVFSA